MSSHKMSSKKPGFSSFVSRVLGPLLTLLGGFVGLLLKLGGGGKRVVEPVFVAVGHANPQLLREWQGKLRWRNLFFTGFLSLAAQAFMLLRPLTQLPVNSTYSYREGPYCVFLAKGEGCAKDVADQFLVNWPFVWADIFRDLSFVLVWALIVGGVYLLAADLAKETRRGTLNFLRMSPLSGSRVLLGKLLGVPILLYIGLALMLPLHGLMGLMSGCSWWSLAGFYGLLGAIAGFQYVAALWFSLLASGLYGLQTWLISAMSFGLLTLSVQVGHFEMAMDWFRFFNPINLLADLTVKGLGWETTSPFAGYGGHTFEQLGWFFLWLGDSGLWFGCFALANALLLGGWFWVALLRKFQTPTLTSLSKVQSYGLTFCLALLMMGFEFQKLPAAGKSWSTIYSSEDFVSYLITMSIWSVLLLFLLLPAKQGLLDWARYHHRPVGQLGDLRAKFVSQSVGGSSFEGSSFWGPRSGAYSGCLRHESSPSPLAFGVNLLIVMTVLVLAVTFKALSVDSADSLEVVGLWLFCAIPLLACSYLLQFIVLSNLVHWRWFALGSVGAVLFGWPAILGAFGIAHHHSFSGFLWLTTIFSGVDNFGAGSILAAIAAHLCVLCSLNWLLNRRIQVLGQSEWKALMASSAAATKAA